MSENIKDEEKILILGLDNSGKTSIILSHKGHRNLMSYFKLKPTKKVDIQKIYTGDSGPSYRIWDFGGQKAYRNGYIEDLEKYSVHATLIIFVIDVQDQKRYGEALDYLEKLTNKFQKINCNAPVYIYLHKFDPGVCKKQGFDVSKVEEDLIPNIDKAIPTGTSYEIHKTSIYTVFRDVLVHKDNKDNLCV